MEETREADRGGGEWHTRSAARGEELARVLAIMRAGITAQTEQEAAERKRVAALIRIVQDNPSRRTPRVLWYTFDDAMELSAAIAFVKGLGPFLEAFATKLGEAFGESTAAALGRLRLFKRRDMLRAELPSQAELTIRLGEATPDEARLALLDLDVTAPELHGKTLEWNTERNTWLEATTGLKDTA